MTEDNNAAAVERETKAAIVEGYRRVKAAKESREEANAIIGEVRATLETHGINRKSFARALEALDMDPYKRKAYDVGYRICREALEVPISAADLVDLMEEQAKAEALKQEQKRAAAEAANREGLAEAERAGNVTRLPGRSSDETGHSDQDQGGHPAEGQQPAVGGFEDAGGGRTEDEA